jgi:DNA (cytosine-5)-methyltransferase 1
MQMKALSLFTGIGGLDLAGKWLGIEVAQMVEINAFCQKTLSKNFPNIAIHSDIKTYNPPSNVFDLVFGGSPCQGYSVAGNRKGSTDPRSGLIKEFLRVCDESKPKFIIFENVRGIHSSGELQAFCECLHRGGYRFDAEIIAASEIGAPHQRERVFVVAYSHSAIKASKRKVFQRWSEQIRSHIAIARTFGKWEKTQLPDDGVDHGVPDRLAGLSAYGNSIVPQCAVIPLLRVKYLAGLAI